MKRLLIILFVIVIVSISISSAKPNRANKPIKTKIHNHIIYEREPSSGFRSNDILLKSPIPPSASVLLQFNVPQQECERERDERLRITKQVRCQPREKIVQLDSTHDLILSPSAVVVNRCDGACDLHHTCIATNTTKKKFHVRQLVKKNNHMQCSVVEVDEHLNCACSCPQRVTECNQHQVYDEVQCKCRCPKDVPQKCKNTKMEMNLTECACKCKAERKCTTGTYWDANKCSCQEVPTTVSSGFNNNNTDPIN